MRCPQCQRKQRRGREGMTCKSCSYRFLFDPKEDHFSMAKKMHDDLFGKIIKHASASGSYHFTENQLFSSARHFVKAGWLSYLITFVLLLAITVAMFFWQFLGGIIFGGIITLVSLVSLLLRISGRYGISRSKWDTFVKKWLSSGRKIPGLIRSPALQRPPQEWAEKDIYDYGVSGIILCNRREILDWLVLNNFHAQNNKLILTPSGYPEYLATLAHCLLAASPELPVWLLHDPGTSREEMLRDCVFPVSNVVDLGVDAKYITNLDVIRSRFPGKEPDTIPLDYIPYKTVSAAVCHCLVSGAVLESVLATGGEGGSDTDVSFG